MKKVFWKELFLGLFNGILGISFMIIPYFISRETYSNFLIFASKEILIVMIGIIIIMYSIHYIIYFIRNSFFKIERVTLYLAEIKDDKCKFLDIKGKKYITKDNNYEEDKFYYVQKSLDKIIEVQEESRDYYGDVEEKINYWLNLYTPIGNFENNPIIIAIYIIIIPIIMSIILSRGTNKIFGISYGLIPISILIFDFYKKYISKNKEHNEKEKEFLCKTLKTIGNIILIAVFSFILFFFIVMFLNEENSTGRFILTLGIVYILTIIGRLLSNTLKNNDMEVKLYKVSKIIYGIVFLIAAIFLTKTELSYNSDPSSTLKILFIDIGIVILMIRYFVKK